MLVHPTLSVFVAEVSDPNPSLEGFLEYLASMPHVRVSRGSVSSPDLLACDVVASSDDFGEKEDEERLARFVREGGGRLRFIGTPKHPLPSVFGVGAGPPGPCCEWRVLWKDPQHPAAHRLPGAFYLKDRLLPLEISAEDAETVLYADCHYRHIPVATVRREGRGRAACTTLRPLDHPVLRQALYRLLLYLAGRLEDRRSLGVGLLGYPPWLGRFHGQGVEETLGLTLSAVCDLDPRRLEEASRDFPRVKTLASADELARDDAVDVVVVATPPDSHASLCGRMMEAGKHVVCEKPLALASREARFMAEAARRAGVHLSCHQNRRWDSDFLAIRQALDEGLLGELFYLETFVGGFSHPCGYWHSHEEIAGGLAYDWGGHYLDWIVALLPEPVESVVCTRHKRVWHDVTNADQERILVRFSGGGEAEFLHSDIAAVRKPKWYLLGTEGALVGHWREVDVHEIDPVHYYRRHEIPLTEMPPDLTLYRRHSSGALVLQKPPFPARRPFPFHANLADHLLAGEPLAAPLEDSVKVVSILEAASRSAKRGGSVEGLHE